MRPALFLSAALLVTSHCAVTPAAEPAAASVQLRTISAGGSADDATDPETVATFDEASFRSTWSKKVGSGEIPSVDFSKEAVVFVFGGTRNTGGYSVDVRGATLDGDALVLDAVVNGPPAGAIVTQVITYPYAVIAVTPRAFRSVRWHETAQAPQR